MIETIYKTVRVGDYDGQMTTFDFSGTTNRTIKIPDADGTIALTSAIPTKVS